MRSIQDSSSAEGYIASKLTLHRDLIPASHKLHNPPVQFQQEMNADFGQYIASEED